MSEQELGLAAVYRLIKKGGAERVSDEAAAELRVILEEIAVKIAQQAVELAEHAGRKTVRAVDIRLASRNLLNLLK